MLMYVIPGLPGLEMPEANTTEGDIDECADVSECGSQHLDECGSQQSDIVAETEGTKHHIRCVCHDRVLCTGGQGKASPTPPPQIVSS